MVEAPQPKVQINFLIVGGVAIEENAHTLAAELDQKATYNISFSKSKLHLVALGEFKEQEARKAMAKARRAGRTASWLKGLDNLVSIGVQGKPLF